MRFQPVEPPRRFRAGPAGRELDLAHVADVELEAGEIVTFRTPDGGEYDVARTTFGFYATPSLEGRLPEHGMRPLLARAARGTFVLLVEAGREQQLASYLEEQDMTFVGWLDGTDDPPPTTR